MQRFEISNGEEFYPASPQDHPSALSPGFASQFYSLSKEKREDRTDSLNDSKHGRSMRALNSSNAGDKSRDKDLQIQLEVNQAKLHSLAKRIDECLSASKTNYSSSKVLQPSATSLSKSSLSDPKERKGSEQVLPDFRPNEINEQPILPQDTSTRSAVASMENTIEDITGTLDQRGKTRESQKKSSMEIKPKSERAPQQGKPMIDTKLPTSSSFKQSTVSPKVLSPTLQKQLETVSSVTVETLEDMGRQRERDYSPEVKKASRYVSDDMEVPKEESLSVLKDTLDGPECFSAGRIASRQSKPQISQTISPIKETENERNIKSQLNDIKDIDRPMRKSPEKPKPQAENETKLKSQPKNEKKPAVQVNPPAKTSKNTTSNVGKKESINEQGSASKVASKAKVGRQSENITSSGNKRDSLAKGNRVEPKSSSMLKTPKQSSQSPLKEYGLPRESNIDFDIGLGLGHVISPVLNDTKSSKGVKDFLTPGYNFDMTHNLSINDTKNISFDSSVFGKELSSAKGDNSRLKVKSTASPNDQSRIKSEYRGNTSQLYGGSQAKNDRSVNDEDLESSFTKAFTLRKNKLIKEVPKFEERMDSDIYFRRRFQNDLDRFLEEYKPRITQEQAEELYERLVEDGRRREVRAHKFELHNKSYKEENDKPRGISSDQINQTFERLVSDAKKRLVLQEEHEKLKLAKQEELEKSYVREKSKGRLNKEAEEQLVMKLTEDAQRRRLQYEKAQRAKLEEEIKEAEDLQKQGFRNKNNTAKSKVKEYIETKSQVKESREGREKERTNVPSKSFYIDQRSLSPSVEENSPNVYEKPFTSDHKFASPKRRYLNILSPSNKSDSKDYFRGMKQTSPSNDSLSSLEYLQHLRKNINRYKNDIEDHIQTIKNIDSSSPLRSNPTSPQKILEPPQQVQEMNRSGIASPKRERVIPQKVTTRYDNVESKVAKHIQGKLTKQPQTQSVQNLKNQDFRETPNSKVNFSGGKGPTKVPQSEAKAGLKYDTKERSDTKKKVQPQSQSQSQAQSQNKFMNDRAAISFVEKLINDFKVTNKV